jgi:hypothetical protein
LGSFSKHIFCLLALVLLDTLAFAQKPTIITFDAKMTQVENLGLKLKIATFIVEKDGETIDTNVTINGRAFYDMNPGHIYTFTFSKSGYVSKFLLVDTREVPVKYKKKSKLKVDVSLFEYRKGLDVEFLKTEAMGIANFNFVRKKLTWNQEYTRSIVEKIIDATLQYTATKEG